MRTLNELHEILSAPDDAVVKSIAEGSGDLILLGVGGKLGPELAIMARRAMDAAGRTDKVIGVARSLEPALADRLHAAGVETFKADLLDPLDDLPDAADVIYLAGRKFGTSGAESTTWALNTYLPGRVCERYPTARTVAFSTGNVYPLVAVTSGGADESTPPGPIGEYAMSCLGRERIFEHFSRTNGTPTAIVRLNYAVEMRYGVLLEIAKAVRAGLSIDLAMGNVNVIWQGDVNSMTLRLLEHCAAPALVINAAGPETVSVRWVAEQFGALLGRKPIFTGEERPTALLSNGTRGHDLFGYPSLPVRTLIEHTAEWVLAKGAVHGKDSHFQQRDGRF
ncbi:NAD-dependent epimerase/dehydratase family protein [Kribbella antibiotica]|uniref:NAD-dependent epimerase/dehydratase family protein n=1 Tax=Kribbella antibiotica TaxID=190195 RepID=A0A4R4ZPL3_9ACTN|nr:NAD-dependent epimerase/dehydratase family protein [Kribbella antibiotica]TDD58852.1 NAD-dependent epimerase/dehydratase family protein [Kribbella antibiotica]